MSHWRRRHCCVLQGGEDKGGEGRVGVGAEVAGDMVSRWHCVQMRTKEWEWLWSCLVSC